MPLSQCYGIRQAWPRHNWPNPWAGGVEVDKHRSPAQGCLWDNPLNATDGLIHPYPFAWQALP
ncbi:MAG: hypothetical protein CTY16_03840 [Methylobacter sp.]|nr:MAG: hypothetical protein CTY16_03840 [Methylobacter sp.]